MCRVKRLRFRGGGSLSTVSKPDEFVKQDDNKEEKKGLSKKAKWGIAGGVGVAALIAFYIAKGKFTEAKKLVENIDFKPAQTIEEAIEFGKKHLGIRSYNGFEAKDIQVINWVNEGLVNTSNKMKGRLRMPKDIVYTDQLDKNTLAGVVTEKGQYEGWFGINKNIFANVNESIDKVLEVLKKGNWIEIENESLKGCVRLDKQSVQPLAEQFEKYQAGNLSFNEKIDFWNSLSVLRNTTSSLKYSPFNFIKQSLAIPQVKTVCENNGLVTNLENIKALTTDEQWKILKDILKLNQGVQIKFNVANKGPFATIYHEMGHIQDMTPRCLTTDKYKFDYSKYSDELKAWVDNQENMQIANRVSEYASHGPGEFIAETFARMIQGNKLPDEVVALYKKLKGPAVPGY